MDFTGLIKKYEVLLAVEKKGEGSYVNGKWVETLTETQFMGTFLPLTHKDLRITEAGAYTTQDKKLFVVEDLKDINGDPLNLKDGDVIINNQGEFEIAQELEAPEVVNYKKYIAKKRVDS
ncbi:hypothetical protein [Anaerosolibacter sp.]|uniref:hypothetical protein n=1 Tax=Anaerosolibacter sp. TaxID=1872527 RepID=UPI0039EE2E08